jgi:hypothetical protein
MLLHSRFLAEVWPSKSFTICLTTHIGTFLGVLWDMLVWDPVREDRAEIALERATEVERYVGQTCAGSMR